VVVVVGANLLNVMWGRDGDLSCVEWDCIEPMAIYAPLDIVGLGREKKVVAWRAVYRRT